MSYVEMLGLLSRSRYMKLSQKALNERNLSAYALPAVSPSRGEGIVKPLQFPAPLLPLGEGWGEGCEMRDGLNSGTI